MFTLFSKFFIDSINNNRNKNYNQKCNKKYIWCRVNTSNHNKFPTNHTWRNKSSALKWSLSEIPPVLDDPNAICSGIKCINPLMKPLEIERVSFSVKQMPNHSWNKTWNQNKHNQINHFCIWIKLWTDYLSNCRYCVIINFPIFFSVFL